MAGTKGPIGDVVVKWTGASWSVSFGSLMPVVRSAPVAWSGWVLSCQRISVFGLLRPAPGIGSPGAVPAQ